MRRNSKAMQLFAGQSGAGGYSALCLHSPQACGALLKVDMVTVTH